MQEFDTFKHPARMQAALQNRLPDLAQGTRRITDCQFLHTHCKTFLKPASREKSWWGATCELQISNQYTGTQHSQLIYAKAFLGGRDRQAFERAAQQRLYPTTHGVAAVRLDDLGLVVWTFPNDPVLTELGEVVEPASVQRHLPWASLPQVVREAVNIDVSVVNYRPEQRCTARYALRWPQADGTQSLTIYGKTFADAHAAEVFRRTEWLWQNSGGVWLMPEPLGFTKATNTLWQAEMKGAPLVAALAREDAQTRMEQAARALVWLHHCALPIEAVVTTEDHLTEIEKKIQKLTHACPAQAASLNTTLTWLSRQFSAVQVYEPRLLHGDFHLRQMLATDAGVALFDFDEFAWGDPAQDLANFAADAQADELAPVLSQWLITAYQQATGECIPAMRLQWHWRVQLITRAYRAYLQQRTDWETRAVALIEMARQGL